MRIAACLFVIALSPAVARAEAPEPDLALRSDRDMTVGLAVNPPPRWAEAGTVAVSAYVGFAKQHALRLNVASFAYDESVFDGVWSLGEDAEPRRRDGRTTDLGIGWQYYSDGWFRGFTFEAGVLRRAIDTHSYDGAELPQTREINSVGYGGRILFGWSWLFARHVFFATGVGLSVGRYTGVETTMADSDLMLMREHFTRNEGHGELYMRFGLAL